MMMAESQPKRIPLAEACRRLRRSPQQMYRLLYAGTIEGEKEGHRWMVSVPSLEQYAARSRELEG